MKWFLALSATLMAMTSVAQEQAYTVRGKVANLQSPATIYLTYKRNGGHTYDSTVLKDGQFSFSGKTIEPFLAVLAVDYEGIGIMNIDRRSKRDFTKQLYVDKGTITVETDDSLSKARISGSAINDDHAAYVSTIEKPFYLKINSLQQTKNPDTALLSQLQAEQKLALAGFIKTHNKSYIAIVALNYYGMTGRGEKTPRESIELFYGLSEDIRQTEAGRAFQQKLKNDSLLVVGKPAPGFSQRAPDNKMISLKDYRGKYVLLDFWASWCGPCREENPNLVAAYAKYKDKNFTILGISLDKPGERDKWIGAIKADNLTWEQVSDLKGWSNEVVALYSISAVPQNYLLDPDGKIIAMNLYGDDLNKFLEKHL